MLPQRFDESAVCGEGIRPAIIQDPAAAPPPFGLAFARLVFAFNGGEGGRESKKGRKRVIDTTMKTQPAHGVKHLLRVASKSLFASVQVEQVGDPLMHVESQIR